jgi:hypothetical protein
VLHSLIAIIVTLVLCVAAFRSVRRQKLRRAAAIEALFHDIAPLIHGARFDDRGPATYPRLTGTYKASLIQVTPVIDTLSTRRLPALWLQVTLQAHLPVRAKFDLMMRPTGPTTFSNFDLLPDTLQLPPGFPEQAIARSDDAAHAIDPSVLAPHLGMFHGTQAKELLIAPTGLRIVWLLAEADRVRYGVFRQAEFGNPVMRAADLEAILDTLIALRADIIAHG